jgi:2-aminoadipate transaminase
MQAPTGIALDPSSETPLYQQLFDQIAERVQSRAFPPGYRLPPTRTMAVQLSTHRNTVVRAYSDLEQAGFVTSTVGRGTFVAQDRPPPPSARPMGSGAMPWGSILSARASSEPLARTERLGRGVVMRDVINLSKMHPSPDLVPHESFRRCIDHVLRTQGARSLGYAPPEGLPRLREAIAVELARRGVPAAAEDVLITTGSQQGLDVVARGLVDPGDTFLLDTLTYSGAINLLTLAGARLMGIASDDEGPDMNALRRVAGGAAKGLYLMPNGGNPTGSVISLRRRRELVEWSRAAAVPLIEDDYGADLILEPTRALPPLRALDGDVLYIGTFSKVLIPALRVGFIVCPPALRRAIASLRSCLDLGTSLLLQHALAEFLDRGYLRAHLNRILEEYRDRRDALLGSLTRHVPSSVGFTRPSRGLSIWMTLPAHFEPDLVFEEAHRRGVLVNPSTVYEVSGGVARGVRLTFCAEPPKRLVEGGRRLGEALTAIARRQRAGRADDRVTIEAV